MKAHYTLADHGGDGVLAMSDSLSLLRQVITATSSDSAGQLLAACVNALLLHQDIDGCELMVTMDAKVGLKAPGITRESLNISSPLESWLRKEVTPIVMESGDMFKEPSLERHGESLRGSLLVWPIRKRGEPLGSLAIWNDSPNSFLPWHETLLEMVSQVLGLALIQLPDASANAADRTALINAPAQTSSPGQSTHPVQKNSIDTLTGLPDRQAFENRLHKLYALPMLARSSCFVLYLDIDRFRLIRDYGGHTNAERVIRTLAEVLKREFETELALGRLGTDEFAVVVERRSLGSAVALADALVDQVDAFKMTFAEQRYDVSISVGIAELHRNSGSGPSAMRHAMKACRAAQSFGGGTVQVYHPRLNDPRDADDHGWMLNQLTNALKNGGLKLYAQSISVLGDAQADEDKLPGLHEILLRLHDENGEIVSAGAFLPLAERYGLSVKLDRWVIQTALHQIADSPYASNQNHRFTINLSGHSIDSHQLLEFILDQFESSGLSPERVCFEITETAAISDIAAAKEFMNALAQTGCQFALDDFGSGYTSFLYLRDLPVDYLKIDGELIKKVADDSVSRSLVSTIQGVAELLGQRTIAEYVESREINDAIASIGCNYAQGYWIGRPLPLEDILREPVDKKSKEL